MRSTAVATVMAVVAFATVPSGAPPAATAIDPDTRVVIRTYEGTTLPADRASTVAAATAILDTTGLDITWVACRVPSGRREDDPCMAPLEAHELAMRFVRLPSPRGHADRMALGDSQVDTGLRAGALATVYVDRVEELAGAWHLDLPTLLGRAIAHEVGHLLLGTATHARVGLMRATWSQDALRRERPGDWVFTPGDAEAMREAVRRRNARHLAALR